MSRKGKLLFLMICTSILIAMPYGCIGGNGDGETTTAAPTTTAPTTQAPTTSVPTTQQPTTLPPETLPGFRTGESYSFHINAVNSERNIEDEWENREIFCDFSFDILPSQEYDLTLHYYGECKEGGETTTFDEQVETNEGDLIYKITDIYDSVAFQLFMFSYVSPWFGDILTDPEVFKVGNEGVAYIGDDMGTYEVLGMCNVAGIEGYEMSMVFNPGGNLAEYIVCVDPSLSMPLSIHYEYSGSGFQVTYIAELISWKEG